MRPCGCDSMYTFNVSAANPSVIDVRRKPEQSFQTKSNTLCETCLFVAQNSKL